jgi:hypothetical protein
MTLCPFSIEDHVSKLLSGEKKQTTRKANRCSFYDILHCWYKPRLKKTCYNCIAEDCNYSKLNSNGIVQLKDKFCSSHRNFFGTAKIESIMKVRIDEHIPEYNMANYTKIFSLQSDQEREEWARRDGFKNFAEADRWFKKNEKKKYPWMDQEKYPWMDQEWDIITFDPDWIKKG